MKKALVLNGEVVQVENETFEVHPSLQWVDCPDWVQPRDTYANNEFTKFAPDATMMAKIVRSIRNQKLLQCDWTQFADIPQETKDAWAVYRQALRDVPLQAGFPLDVNWPVPPA